MIERTRIEAVLDRIRPFLQCPARSVDDGLERVTALRGLQFG
jgi:hypothetical protein